MLKQAKGVARSNLVARFARQETEEVEARVAKETAQQDSDFEALHQQLVAEVGARGTSWDLLWNPLEDQQYYLHVEDGGSIRRYPKETAMCDKCDAMIAPEDRVCADCQAERSAKNEELYVGFKV